MLYLVICEVHGTPPPATVESLEAGKTTLEMIRNWQEQGIVHGAGVFSGRMGMAFVIDAASNAELHALVASLPTFTHAEWQVIPMLGIDEDLVMTEAALARYREAR